MYINSSETNKKIEIPERCWDEDYSDLFQNNLHRVRATTTCRLGLPFLLKVTLKMEFGRRRRRREVVCGWSGKVRRRSSSQWVAEQWLWTQLHCLLSPSLGLKCTSLLWVFSELLWGFGSASHCCIGSHHTFPSHKNIRGRNTRIYSENLEKNHDPPKKIHR